MHTPIKTLFAWFSVVSAIIAALLWLGSTFARVPPSRVADVSDDWADGPIEGPVEVEMNGIALNATAALQAHWNRWAAGASAVAALFQALSMMP